MNIRLVLAGAALGALTAGGLYAQDQTYAARHTDRCDTAHPSRTPYACKLRAERLRAYRRAHPYAAGYWAPDNSDFYGPYGQPADVRPAYYPPAPPAYYPPPDAEAYGAPAAYEGPPPPGVAPVYVPGRRYYWEYYGDTSPGADTSVRLHSYANPHTSVTAIPTPNNVSDQVPSHGPDYDGVPPYIPY